MYFCFDMHALLHTKINIPFFENTFTYFQWVVFPLRFWQFATTKPQGKQFYEGCCCNAIYALNELEKKKIWYVLICLKLLDFGHFPRNVAHLKFLGNILEKQ